MMINLWGEILLPLLLSGSEVFDEMIQDSFTEWNTIEYADEKLEIISINVSTRSQIKSNQINYFNGSIGIFFFFIFRTTKPFISLREREEKKEWLTQLSQKCCIYADWLLYLCLFGYHMFLTENHFSFILK